MTASTVALRAKNLGSFACGSRNMGAMLRARSERQPELGDDAREAFAEPEPTSSPGGVSFGFVSHRGFGDVTPSASDLVHGDVDAIPAELRPIITQGEPMRIAQLIVAHPQLQAPIYTAMQRQHGYAAVQSVAKLAT